MAAKEPKAKAPKETRPKPETLNKETGEIHQAADDPITEGTTEPDPEPEVEQAKTDDLPDMG
ncbi:hypothetical protein D3C75_1037210 [compost metagenome]